MSILPTTNTNIHNTGPSTSSTFYYNEHTRQRKTSFFYRLTRVQHMDFEVNFVWCRENRHSTFRIVCFMANGLSFNFTEKSVSMYNAVVFFFVSRKFDIHASTIDIEIFIIINVKQKMTDLLTG